MISRLIHSLFFASQEKTISTISTWEGRNVVKFDEHTIWQYMDIHYDIPSMW